MSILIRWLRQKPADLDLQSFQKKDQTGFSRTKFYMKSIKLAFRFCLLYDPLNGILSPVK